MMSWVLGRSILDNNTVNFYKNNAGLRCNKSGLMMVNNYVMTCGHGHNGVNVSGYVNFGQTSI